MKLNQTLNYNMDLKVDALRAKYQYEKLEAIATLEVYVKNSVGIGEHPQVIEEMAKLVEQVANANDCLATLDEIFVRTPDGESTVGQDGSVNS
ncbi:MAG: hypothetical protein ACKVJK_10975 [Methylophagaceae bacterium]|jgi:hypothetical protein|tara:strand:- start:197 stop:475 length:279 start_codon:yes stop_codon:yes gene_type:complete